MTGKGPCRYYIPEGDDRERLVCPDCNYIAYENPKIVVGVVCLHQDNILLCRRAIEPRSGFWTIPAGFLELHESTEEGAIRESYEEAGIKPALEDMLALYNLPYINQVQIFYKASVDSNNLSPGIETLEAEWFSWDEIPWQEIAFPTVTEVLNTYSCVFRDKKSLALPHQKTFHEE